MRSGRRLIGIYYPPGMHYTAGVSQGIRLFARSRPEWYIRKLHWQDAQAQFRLDEPVCGVVGHFSRPEMLRHLLNLKVPVVNTSNVVADMPFSRVGVDEGAVGRLAAEHLDAVGLKQFAFLAPRGVVYCSERYAGFAKALADAGHTPPPDGWWRSVEQIISCPDSIGVLTHNDYAAAPLLEQCRTQGIRVPDKISIIGVDNDADWCETAWVPLSSVDVAPQAIGYTAAELLSQMLRARRPMPPTCKLLEPAGVVVRRSSDVISATTPEVRAAAHYIREHAHRRIGVSDVVQFVPMSRRTLERHFRRELGHTVLEELRLARIELAKDLLAGTDLDLRAIARRCGIGTSKRLCAVFRQLTGMTAIAYRGRFRRADWQQ